MITAATKIFSVCFFSSFNEKGIAFDFVSYRDGTFMCMAQAFCISLSYKICAYVSMSCVHSVIISPTICSLPGSIKSKIYFIRDSPMQFFRSGSMNWELQGGEHNKRRKHKQKQHCWPPSNNKRSWAILCK